MRALRHSALGAAEEPPAGFHFSGDAERSSTTIDAVYRLHTAPTEVRTLLAPPVQASGVALRGAIEATAGADLGALAAGQIAAGAPILIQSMLADLLNSSADLAVEAVSASVASAVGDAIGCIPVLGGIVRGVLALLTGFAFDAGGGPDLMQCVQNQLNSYCRRQVERHKAQATSMYGVTPADQFRPVAYAYQLGSPLPLCPASLYVMLCGMEAEGFAPYGWESSGVVRSPSDDYQTILATGTNELGRQAGIEPEFQRVMWRLIKGIMAQCEDPTLGQPPTDSDQGRSLMPILQEIVRQHVVPPELGGRGVVSENMLRAMSIRVGDQYTTSCCDEGVCLRRGCGGRLGYGHVDLTDSFMDGLVKWENQLEGTYWDSTTGGWTLTPAGIYLRQLPKKGLLRIASRTTEQIAEELKRIIKPTYRPTAEPAALSPIGGLALGTGLVGLGYGAWTALSRWGPKLLK